jgi:hypothetical protein
MSKDGSALSSLGSAPNGRLISCNAACFTPDMTGNMSGYNSLASRDRIRDSILPDRSSSSCSLLWRCPTLAGVIEDGEPSFPDLA